jgi:hypothetical protein
VCLSRLISMFVGDAEVSRSSSTRRTSALPSMFVAVRMNDAAIACVTVTLAGIGPKNGGEELVSVTTLT